MDKLNPNQNERKIFDSGKLNPAIPKFLRETEERILMQPSFKSISQMQTNQQISLPPNTNKSNYHKFSFLLDCKKYPNLEIEIPISPGRDEDYSFIHDAITPTKLKLKQAPILEIPKPHNEESMHSFNPNSQTKRNRRDGTQNSNRNFGRGREK